MSRRKKLTMRERFIAYTSLIAGYGLAYASLRLCRFQLNLAGAVAWMVLFTTLPLVCFFAAFWVATKTGWRVRNKD